MVESCFYHFKKDESNIFVVVSSSFLGLFPFCCFSVEQMSGGETPYPLNNFLTYCTLHTLVQNCYLCYYDGTHIHSVYTPQIPSHVMLVLLSKCIIIKTISTLYILLLLPSV